MIDFKNDIKNYNFKQLNDSIKSMDLIKISSGEFTFLLETLKNDKRKNVNKLGEYIEKERNKYFNEIKRVNTLYDFDRIFSKNTILAGVDEVGRGPLAGPIVAAAVVLNLEDLKDIIMYINDSKSLSSSMREKLAEEIKNRAVSYAIASCSNEEIDEFGISYCNNRIFLDSISNLAVTPNIVLSDGYKVKDYNGNNEAVTKGDTKSASIACASIIAKVYRDNLMIKYHEAFPDYDFKSNVGYGSKTHIEAIKRIGICKIHRKTFVKNFI